MYIHDLQLKNIYNNHSVMDRKSEHWPNIITTPTTNITTIVNTINKENSFYTTNTRNDILQYVPEKMNNPTIMSIYIGTHGKIMPNMEIRPSPPGITINKKNLAGIGACTSLTRVDNELDKIKQSNIIALSLLKNFFISYNETQYLNSISSTVLSKTNMTKSCEVFNNPSNGWVQKMYTYKTKPPYCVFSIAYMDNVIELLHSSVEEFNIFISKLPVISVNHSVFIDHMEQIYNRICNREKTFYTKDIFLIIYIFKHYYNIKTVNILDETCNTVYSTEGLPIDDYKLPLNTGYGGKKTKKYKKHNKSISRIK